MADMFDAVRNSPEKAGSQTRRGRTRTKASQRPSPTKAPRGRGPAARRICDFCSNNAVGQIMHAARACDWRDGKYPLECTNCADYRARHPVEAAGHVCQVPRKALLYRKYSAHHPARYDQAVSPQTGLPTDEGVCCVRCIADGKTVACDVDPILGYQCSRCKPADMCQLRDGRFMDNKPNLRQGVVKWFRHACDGCAQLAAGRRRGRITQCSWLQDHTTWDRACDRCRSNNLVCLASAIVASMPAAISIPENWRPRSFIALGWAELRPNTVWRKACMNCRRDNNHCRASIANPYSACGRCTAMGLDCVDEEGTAYPIFDLSQVGFGSFLPFTACRRCVEMGRNCDRQRPCDSCTSAGEAHLCDHAFLRTDSGKKRMANCLHGRLYPRPGPLYYLAHGYGANGVNDVKDGSRMEHWIGPLTETYVMPSVSFHEGSLVREVSKQRELLVPRAATPPHAAPGTPLAGKPASELTADDIAAMINEVWTDAFLMNDSEDFVEQQRNAAMKKDMFQFNTPAGTDNPPTAADIAAAINPRPDMRPRHIVTVIPPLPVVRATSSSEDEGADSYEEDGESDDSGSQNSNNGNNNIQNITVFQQAAQSLTAANQLLPQATQQSTASTQSVLVSQEPTQPTAAPNPSVLILHQIMQTLAAQPAAASHQPGLTYQLIMQSVATLAPTSRSVPPAQSIDDDNFMDVDTPRDAKPPIDPALQSWGPPILPYIPFSRPPSISPETDTMPGHAMTLPASPTPTATLDIPDMESADLLEPRFTSFLDAAATTEDWLPASNSAHVAQQTRGASPLQAVPPQIEGRSEQALAIAKGHSPSQQGPARWSQLSPLHESTRTLLGTRHKTGGRLARAPFTLAISYMQRTCPVRDVLHGLPEPEFGSPSEAAGTQPQREMGPSSAPRCGESRLGEGDKEAYMTCGAAVQLSDRCVDTHHDPNHPSLVCDTCAQHSAEMLMDPRHDPLTTTEVLSMRSYLCERCTAYAGSSPEAMLTMCQAGINTVYGRFPKSQDETAVDDDGDVVMTAPDGGNVVFFGKVRPLTGCACGVKIFQTRQCQFHRIDNAEAVLRQVAAVREWRVQTLQQGKCAGCFEPSSEPDDALHEDQQQGENKAAAAVLKSWVCLACGGWVMNQETAGLVDGWQSWFDRQPESLADILEEANGMDIEMTDV
ncbi:hypothetical protein MY11210_000879 [Beauveria gryllotalpidicola]